MLIEKLSLTSKIAALIEQKDVHEEDSVFFKKIRFDASETFLKLGLPNRKNEEYKYSNPDKLFNSDFTLAKKLQDTSSVSVEKYIIPNLNANTVVLINGNYEKQLSSTNNLPPGVLIEQLSVASKKYALIFEAHFSKYANTKNDPFIALNTAIANDGVFVFVPENTKLNQPLHIINLVSSSENVLVSPRNLFIVEKNANACIIETFETYDLTAKSITNTLTEIAVLNNASLAYYKLQNECENGRQINTSCATIGKSAHFDTNTVTLNGEWVRNNLSITLAEEHCETHLNGLLLGTSICHIDNHTAVNHQAPNCQSNQLYKGILDGKSTGVFNGKIFVAHDAQKTNAYQSSKNILLSDDATMNTKPQLEIYADDVKCSHGSTTGQLNEDALFYLRARGLSESSAKKLLLHAFANEVLNTIKIDSFKTYLEELVNKKLAQ